MSKYLVDPYKMFPDSSHVRYYEKKWAEIFFSLKSLHFFSKIGDFNNLLGPKKCSNKFQGNCRISLWTLINCSLRFVTLDNSKKDGPKASFIVETAVF